MNNIKTLVTGATGFIGSHLVPKLSTNHQVATLNARTVSNSNTEWHQAVDDCDVLIHLAGRAHVSSNNSLTESDIYKIINTELTCVLAERLAKQSSKRIIFVSTAVVFGAVSNPNQPFRTSDIPNPDGPYAQSKIEAENAIIKICEKTSLTYTIIRPPLVYGPNVRANFLSMLKWVNAGVPLPLGKTQNLRSLVGIRNLVDLIENCMTNPDASNKIFNVSDNHDLSTTDLLNMIASAMSKKSKLIPIPPIFLKFGSELIRKPRAYEGLCESFQLNISETSETLSWVPPYSLQQEIDETVRWFQTEIKR